MDFTNKKTHKFSQILIKADEFPYNSVLFCDRSLPYSLDSECIILSQDEIQKDDTVIEKALIINGKSYSYSLNLSAIQDVVENAKQQKQNPSPEDLIKAFNFYFNNDAFINFNK